MDEIVVLKYDLKETERISRLLDKKIADLELKVKSEKNPALLKIKYELDKQHKINLLDIANCKSQIIVLENILKSQKSLINNLKKENKNLKPNIIVDINNSPIYEIKGIKDLPNNFGLKIFDEKKEQNEQDNKIKEDKKKEESKKKELEKLKKIIE